MTYTLPQRVAPQHLDELDSIRGLAALAVLLDHTLLVFHWPRPLPWVNWPVINMLFDGLGAVTMFFVLSGFVLSRPFVREAARTLTVAGAGGFYVRRVTRVWLPWLCVFGVSLLVKVLLFTPQATIPPQTEWLAGFWRMETTLHDVLLQCLYSLHDARRQMLPQDWSLGVEMKASALMPLMILAALRSSWLLALWGTAMLVVLPHGHYYAPFFVGVLLARHFTPVMARFHALPTWARAVVVCAGIALYQSRLLFAGQLDGRLDLEKGVWIATSIGAALLMVASMGCAVLSRFLHRPAVRLLGRVSFSLYLVQFIVIVWLVPLLVATLNHAGVIDSDAVFVFTFGISVPSTLLLAWCSHRWIERPSIELGRRLSALIVRPGPAALAIAPRVPRSPVE